MEPTQKRSPRQEAPASFEFLPVFTPPRLALFQGRGVVRTVGNPLSRVYCKGTVLLAFSEMWVPGELKA